MYFFSAKVFLILAIITAKIIYLGFLVSYANGVALIIWISKVLSKLKSSLVSYVVFLLFKFKFSIKYKISIRFRFGFFKYFFIVKY